MKKFRTFCLQQLSENLDPNQLQQAAQTALQLQLQLKQLAVTVGLPEEIRKDAEKVAEEAEALVKNLQAFYAKIGIE